MMKTLILLVHDGLFWCFHSPPNSDMGYKIFNVRIRSFCMRIHKRDLVYRLIRRTFCRVFQCCVFSE